MLCRLFEASDFFETDIQDTKLIKEGSNVNVIINDVISPKVIIQPKSIIGFIPLNINDAGNVSIKFYNIYGQLALEKKDYFNNGNHMVMVPTELPSGQYTVSIDQDTKHLGNQSIIIMK